MTKQNMHKSRKYPCMFYSGSSLLCRVFRASETEKYIQSKVLSRFPLPSGSSTISCRMLLIQQSHPISSCFATAFFFQNNGGLSIVQCSVLMRSIASTSECPGISSLAACVGGVLSSSIWTLSLGMYIKVSGSPVWCSDDFPVSLTFCK